MNRSLSFVLALGGLLSTSGCDLGFDVSGPDPSGGAPLALAPAFAVAPTPEELAALDRLRVTLRNAGDSSVVEVQEGDIDPAEDHWEVSMKVPTGEVGATAFFVQAELADLEGGGESVEWSGSTDPFPVQAADRPLEVRLVLLYRGPLANLGLTGLTLSRRSLRIAEGATSSLRWTAEGVTEGTVVYFASADTSVAEVDSSGLVTSRGIGGTTVYVFGGPAEDSVEVEVGEVVLPPEPEVDSIIDPSLEYVTGDLFISTFHDAAGGEAVRNRFLALRSLLQAGDAPGVIEAFEAAKAEWQTYGIGTPVREVDEPQLGVLELTLLRVATGLSTAFP